MTRFVLNLASGIVSGVGGVIVLVTLAVVMVLLLIIEKARKSCGV
jgi:hypothetical protein